MAAVRAALTERGIVLSDVDDMGEAVSRGPGGAWAR
jgi:CRISPR/Cas system-associated protein Cas10 (large subunit of type III CRISPR-Cas system)